MPEMRDTFQAKTKTIHLVWGKGDDKSTTVCGQKIPEGEAVLRPYSEVTCKTCRRVYEND